MTEENLPSTAVSAPDAPAPALKASDVWAGLMDMAKDPSVDTDRLRVIADIQKDVLAMGHAEDDRIAKRKWDNAFARACAEMPIITKDNKIEHNGKFLGWFKKYEDIRPIVDPIIAKYNLHIAHDSEEIEGGKAGITVWTVIMYVDADHTWTETRGRMPVPPDTSGAKTPGQTIGSSSEYGKRYSLVGAFGIVQKGLDKDGTTPTPQLEAPKRNALAIEAHAVAAEGTDAYQEWFLSKTRAERVTLTSETESDPADPDAQITVHDLCKLEAKAAD